MNDFRRFRQLHRTQRSPIDLGSLAKPVQTHNRVGRVVKWLAAAAAVFVVGAGLVWLALPDAEPKPNRSFLASVEPPSRVPEEAATTVEATQPGLEPSDIAPETEAVGQKPRLLIPSSPARVLSTPLTPPQRGRFSLPSRQLPTRNP